MFISILLFRQMASLQITNLPNRHPTITWTWLLWCLNKILNFIVKQEIQSKKIKKILKFFSILVEWKLIIVIKTLICLIPVTILLIKITSITTTRMLRSLVGKMLFFKEQLLNWCK